MSEAGTTPVTARLAFGTKQLLADIRPLFKTERARARALSATSRWDWDGLPRREAAAKRAQWAMRRTHLRETGELTDTLDILVASGVRAELAARGWDQDWPPLPAQAKNPSRWQAPLPSPPGWHSAPSSSSPTCGPCSRQNASAPQALSATPEWDWDGPPGREATQRRTQWAMYRGADLPRYRLSRCQ